MAVPVLHSFYTLWLLRINSWHTWDLYNSYKTNIHLFLKSRLELQKLPGVFKMNRAEKKKQKTSRPEGQRKQGKKQTSYWNPMRKVKCIKSVGNNARWTIWGSARLWATGKSKLIAAHVHLAAPGQRDSRMPHTLSSPKSCLPLWFQSLATAATRQWHLQST